MYVSAVQGDAIAVQQNAIYRARVLIKAPGAVATEGKVRAAFGEHGFADIVFFDKDNLPPDWPPDQVEDTSGLLSWTAYLQGRFVNPTTRVPLSELGSSVTLQGMWVYMVPLVAPPPGLPVLPPPPTPAEDGSSMPPLPPQVDAAPSDVPSVSPSEATAEPGMATRVVVSALGVAGSFWLVKVALRAVKRGRL